MDKTAKGAKPTSAKRKPAAKTKAAGTAARSKKPATKKPSIAERIEAIGIDSICSMFADGMTHTAIAAEVGVSHGNLSEWLAADPDRSARAREARTHAARVWDEKALEAIEQAEDPFQLQRARELAQHYRWRASKTAPKDYGDKLAVGGAEDLGPVQVTKQMTDAERAVRLSRLLSGSPDALAALLGAKKGDPA